MIYICSHPPYRPDRTHITSHATSVNNLGAVLRFPAIHLGTKDNQATRFLRQGWPRFQFLCATNVQNLCATRKLLGHEFCHKGHKGHKDKAILRRRCTRVFGSFEPFVAKSLWVAGRSPRQVLGDRKLFGVPGHSPRQASQITPMRLREAGAAI